MQPGVCSQLARLSAYTPGMQAETDSYTRAEPGRCAQGEHREAQQVEQRQSREGHVRRQVMPQHDVDGASSWTCLTVCNV